MKSKKRQNLISFKSLSAEEKQSVVFYIQRNGVSIRQASIDLHMTTNTINKIYSEKFGKKDREHDQNNTKQLKK
tara:strand:+ start:828 stop:1049 length:222 start_codon:yes stop_codon:yes gene_type:complete